GKREKGEKGTFGIFSSRLDTLGGVADHAGDKSTSSFRPSAAAPLWSVTSLGLSIFPVSNRDRAGASMPIRPAGADSWLSHKALDRLETDPNFKAGFGTATVKAYRKRMQQIRAAADERDLYALKSLHFEKLKGKRANQGSVRLNDQWRLILEIIPGQPKNRI